jgi:hypothetical protein
LLTVAPLVSAGISHESKAVGKDGTLHRPAEMSVVKKCKRDACQGQGVSKEGKPLHGAAKKSFTAKCMKSA